VGETDIADPSLARILEALAHAPEPHVPLTAGELVDRYEILGLIGQGGMGSVYRARDTRLERVVALKLLRTPDHWPRLEREARTLAALTHPNVVVIHDFGVHDGRPFLALELLEGVTLRDRLREGRLPIDRAVEVAAAVLSGLAAAHDLGVVHRDLKPENLFLSSGGPPKVLDFGLAKRLPAMGDPTQHTRTQAGVVMGTASYMSPEQVRGEEVDARADVFSFGAVLWEMLTGRQAFSAPTPVEAMHRILREEPAPLDECVPGVPPPIAAFVEKCLAKSRDDRFPSGGAAAQALATARAPGASEEPVRAPRPVLGYARSGSKHLAYQTFGQGPYVVLLPGFVSNIEQLWDDPDSARFLRELGRIARVTMFDKRGTGLSDRLPADEPAMLDQLVEDLRAVADVAGAARPILLGASEGAQIAIGFAATFPERARALVLLGTFPTTSPDFARDGLMPFAGEGFWGTGRSIDFFAPSVASDEGKRRWWARYERGSASPGALATHIRAMPMIDVRPLLERVRAPTLFLHRRDDALAPLRSARRMAERVPGARFIELPGTDHFMFFGDTRGMLDEIRTFIAALADEPGDRSPSSAMRP
jgi:pimeloyl-ACP methyl ester carboxylesterase